MLFNSEVQKGSGLAIIRFHTRSTRFIARLIRALVNNVKWVTTVPPALPYITLHFSLRPPFSPLCCTIEGRYDLCGFLDFPL